MKSGLLFCGVIATAACGTRAPKPHAPYVPLAEVGAIYGPLITSGNHPTASQNGTGERLGLFLDSTGTVWGLPLSVTANGAVLACAPDGLRKEKVTDTFPAGASVIGATNEPSGWRGGTGNLELLLRDPRGAIHWQSVSGAPTAAGPACWAPEFPGPPQQLYYYRLAPKAAE